MAHKTLDISFLGDVAWYSALTNPDRFPMPANRGDEEIGFGVPITYVPLRNTIFLSLAAALLESNVLNAIETDGEDPADVTAAVYLAPKRNRLQRLPGLPPGVLSQRRRDDKSWQQAGHRARRPH